MFLSTIPSTTTRLTCTRCPGTPAGREPKARDREIKPFTGRAGWIKSQISSRLVPCPSLAVSKMSCCAAEPAQGGRTAERSHGAQRNHCTKNTRRKKSIHGSEKTDGLYHTSLFWAQSSTATLRLRSVLRLKPFNTISVQVCL
jgi:hypothetical protein